MKPLEVASEQVQVSIAAGASHLRHRGRSLLIPQLLQSPQQPLFADPFRGGAVEFGAKGLLKRASRIVAASFQVAEPKGLVQIVADVVEQVVEGAFPLPRVRTLAIGWPLLQQGGIEVCGHQAMQHIIQAQARGKPVIHGEAGIDVPNQRLNLSRPEVLAPGLGQEVPPALEAPARAIRHAGHGGRRAGHRLRLQSGDDGTAAPLDIPRARRQQQDAAAAAGDGARWRAHLPCSRQAGHQMDRRTIGNGELDRRAAEAHQGHMADGRVGYALKKAAFVLQGAKVEDAHRCACGVKDGGWVGQPLMLEARQSGGEALTG